MNTCLCWKGSSPGSGALEMFKTGRVQKSVGRDGLKEPKRWEVEALV